ncbi:unnamed protein product, partial [Phaeothamnion confervicola]
GGYDWVLIEVTAADGTDRSSATVATARELVISVPVGLNAWTVRIAGYNSATGKKSVVGKSVVVNSSGDKTKVGLSRSVYLLLPVFQISFLLYLFLLRCCRGGKAAVL